MDDSPLLKDGVRRPSDGNLVDGNAAVIVAGGAQQVYGDDKDQDGAIDIEDLLDDIGGLGWYQLRHFAILGFFWFANFATLSSVFMNGPFCATNTEDDCSDPQNPDPIDPIDPPCELGFDERGLCCGELTSAALNAGCTMPDWGRMGSMNNTFWGDCTSVSCQFNLSPNGENGDRAWLRSLFDSSFFLGWMWSVPLGGWLADRKGRKVALLCAYTVLMCSTVAAAFATTPTFYLIARHFNGVGIGSQSMSAYVLGTEVRCLLLCIRVSTLRKREPPEVSGGRKTARDRTKGKSAIVYQDRLGTNTNRWTPDVTKVNHSAHAARPPQDGDKGQGVVGRRFKPWQSDHGALDALASLPVSELRMHCQTKLQTTRCRGLAL
jgi:hypothetical protein